MNDYTLDAFDPNSHNVLIGFDGRQVNFPLPIIDGKYPEGEALHNLLSAYVRNARSAPPPPPPPFASNADSIQRMVVPPADFEMRRAVVVARNRLLLATDWTQMNDSPLAGNLVVSWKNYRQTLRDIPRQTGFPYNVVWPVPPSQITGPAGVVLTEVRGAPTQFLIAQGGPAQIQVRR